MAIWVNNQTKLLVQGITGAQGLFHAKGCRDYGTQVVGGVTPGKGGTSIEGFSVYDTVEEAVKKTGANATMIFVPPPGAADAICEAADAGIPLIVCITEGIPVRDMLATKRYLKSTKSRLIGPNCPGIITPGAVQDRHHAGPHPQARQYRRRLALGHADVRSRPSAHASSASARAPASASAATRSMAPTSSTCSKPTIATRTRTA